MTNKRKIKFNNKISKKMPLENSTQMRDPKKQIIIEKLMIKFNLTELEAQKILAKIENKSQNNSIKNHDPPKNVITEPPLMQKSNSNNKRIIEKNTYKNKNKELIKKDSPTKILNNNQISYNKPHQPNKNQKDVNSLLNDIIPNHEKKISIEVNHVDLTFETEIDKIDTIKEKVIRTIKNDKSPKKRIHALKDISFKIYQGEKIGIIGYNGAGKSTLLNVISGIYQPDKGNVIINGNISPLLSLGAGFDPNYSGAKNIFLNGAVLGYDKKFIQSKYDEIVEFSELGEFIDIPIKNYSSGMLAKLGFSIATIVEPDILIIDEILGVGDLNFQKKSGDKIKSLMDGQTTVILVSHSISHIRNLCDKAIWIDNGALRMIGESNQVCDSYVSDSQKASREQLKNIEL